VQSKRRKSRKNSAVKPSAIWDDVSRRFVSKDRYNVHMIKELSRSAKNVNAAYTDKVTRVEQQTFNPAGKSAVKIYLYI